MAKNKAKAKRVSGKVIKPHIELEAASGSKWLPGALLTFGWLTHLLFWMSLKTGWLTPLFTDTSHLFGPGCDFFALYQAGHAAVTGDALYTYKSDHMVIPYGYPFRYLPVAAYFPGALLTLVSPVTAYVLWLGLNELIFLKNVQLTWKMTKGGLQGALLCTVWLVFSPLYVHMWLGQFTLLLASLLFWCVVEHESGHSRRSQWWWFLSVAWKPASIIWLPIWVRSRRYWSMLLATGIMLAANGLYFLINPKEFAVFSDANLRLASLWVSSNIGASALIYQFTGATLTFTALRVIMIIGLVIPALLVTWRSPRQPLWLLGSIWTVLFFLVYKEVWEQHLVLILPFIILGLRSGPGRMLWAATLLLALPSPFVFYDVRGLGIGVDPQPYFTPLASIIHHSWRVVPLVMLYVYWLAQARTGRFAAHG